MGIAALHWGCRNVALGGQGHWQLCCSLSVVPGGQKGAGTCAAASRVGTKRYDRRTICQSETGRPRVWHPWGQLQVVSPQGGPPACPGPTGCSAGLQAAMAAPALWLMWHETELQVLAGPPRTISEHVRRALRCRHTCVLCATCAHVYSGPECGVLGYRG